MSSSSLVRWGVLGALLAGIAWAASDIFALVLPGGEEDLPPDSASYYLIESLDAIAEASMLAALVGLHGIQARASGRLGVAGFAVAFIGTALVFVITFLGVILALALTGKLPETLGSLVFGLGWLGWLVGFPLLGIATFQARVLPR